MKITVYGLGALGSNLLVQLVRQFPEQEFVGVDFDTIEERNLRTQAYFIEQVGQPKVLAMFPVLQRYVRKLRYTPKSLKVVTPPGAPGRDELWLDCFDNSKSRKLLAPKGDHAILHVGFSPFYTAECIWNHHYDVPGDVDPTKQDICSLPDAVAFIGTIVSFAMLNVVDFIQKGVKRDFIVTNRNTVKYL